MRLLLWFGSWFASAPGVWQTFAICMAVVAAELTWPSADPHMFWFLVVLTVYSAVTQPVLAFIGARSGEHQEKILAHCEQILAHLEQLSALHSGTETDPR